LWETSSDEANDWHLRANVEPSLSGGIEALAWSPDGSPFAVVDELDTLDVFTA
jgi:hypothetical protein